MKFSKSFGNSYDRFMHLVEKHRLRRRRARLLSGLRGRVLEVGVGTGINFEHYGPEVELTGIEPSPHMLAHAERRRLAMPRPERARLHPLGCGSTETEALFAPGSLDAVVCTLVLCTIPEPERALRRFLEWLKPGGKLLVLEHIRSHRHLPGRLQDLARPLWASLAEGCQLNRPTDKLLAESGFRLVREERFRVGLPFYEAVYEKPRD